VVPRASGLDGLFLGSHAVAQGMLNRHQLRSGVYRRVLHGVYAHPALAVDHAVTARAAALLMPPGAAVGGVSAAWWHGGPLPGATDPVTVVLPEGAEWTGPRGVRVHRTRLRPGEVTMKDDVPCTTVTRTAWDVCSLESTRTAVACLDALLRARAVTQSELEGLARVGAGRWGAAKVRRAIALADARSASPPESWLRVAFIQAGLPPCVPQFEVVADGVFLGRVDMAWPERRVIVEYEGAYHFDGVQIVKDDARYARLLAAGWRVIRVGAADLRDMGAVVAQVTAALVEAGTDR
jgi:Protein of unknown function (DUF559)